MLDERSAARQRRARRAQRRPNRLSKKLPTPELDVCCTSGTPPPTLPGGRGMLEVEAGAAAMRCGGWYCGCEGWGADASGNGAAIWRGGGGTERAGGAG